MNIDNNHTRFNFQISWLLIASSRKENQDIDPYPALSLMSLFSSVQSLSRVQLFATPWTAARQASLTITNSRSLLKFMPIESVMPSNHLIFCRPLYLSPSILPSIRAFSSESALHIRVARVLEFQLQRQSFQ